jgi:hypothetical protein
MNITETRCEQAHYNVTMNGFVHTVLRKIISPFKRTGLLRVLFEIFYVLSVRYRLDIKIEKKKKCYHNKIC